MGNKRCYALLCAYDGGAFSGFQRQPPLPTVQGALEDALLAIGCKVRIEGGGRTDAGVHARRQVVTFRTAMELPVGELPALLAPHLPEGLQVPDAVQPPWSFHARFSAVGKVYRYRIAAVAEPSEEDRRFAWALPDLRGFPDVTGPVLELDEGAMRSVLTTCTGRHDFSNLVHPNAEGDRKRLLTRAELRSTSERGGTTYEITFGSPGFIRHQLRNIVGVAVSAGLGKLPPGLLEQLLSGQGDRWRGPRAPGRGLCLWEIQYRRGEDPFRRADAQSSEPEPR
ncbi:tRNA pseudouridine synthase A [Vulgatibacter incomptus]|uniref:tRNA pseudouridine synthase A n=1 Tax=Vulgatibacter incomptus TaxID=1391653 RepID=A0A0K1PE10_9BACT|nr:tRNA pseudouridine synthase A [Vulgatibacter incomptus]AKU91745.1 tRNA pseudouridine synthase A [Vulgatibacter incomptus]